MDTVLSAWSEQVNNVAQDQTTPVPGDTPSGTSGIQEILVDDTATHAGYANFCRVAGTPEELILDLRLNPSPYAAGKVTVNVSQRIILNHFTAKRLLNALGTALQRHEQTFATLEIDVRKRVRVSGHTAADSLDGRN